MLSLPWLNLANGINSTSYCEIRRWHYMIFHLMALALRHDSSFMLYWDLCTCLEICVHALRPVYVHWDSWLPWDLWLPRALCTLPRVLWLPWALWDMHWALWHDFFSLLDATCAASSLILRGRFVLLDHLIEVVAFEDLTCLPSTHLASFEVDVGWFRVTHLGRPYSHTCRAFEHFLGIWGDNPLIFVGSTHGPFWVYIVLFWWGWPPVSTNFHPPIDDKPVITAMKTWLIQGVKPQIVTG